MTSRARRTAHPLPPHAFIAGKTARHADDLFAAVPVDERYAFGCDLFEHGFFFEAHELWELVWRDARRTIADEAVRHDVDHVLRALIKLCAAFVKERQGMAEGKTLHLGGAVALLADVESARVLDVDVAGLRQLLLRAQHLSASDTAQLALPSSPTTS